MSRTYLILALILTALAAGLVLLPSSGRTKQVSPEKLMTEIGNPARYISADRVSARIIDEDPSVLLVDVRPKEQYSEFSLPRAINIPLEKVLDKANRDYLDRKDLDVIFLSNNGLKADQAWILCKRMGYKNLYVMEGGLNKWYNDIMMAKKPPATASSEDFNRYSFRKAAGMFFRGGNDIESQSPGTRKNIIIQRREKKVVKEGGC